MKTLADRFRRWYDHECDCHAKCLAMLDSVPVERRATADFQKAIDRMAHLMAARQRWLTRLGHFANPLEVHPKGLQLADLPGLLTQTETAWLTYLERLDDTELARELDWVMGDGKRYRWNVEGILTQLSGHAWYHRGQIAQLVATLGGKAVDTDYVLWAKLTPVESAG